jgi:hypothetical protein
MGRAALVAVACAALLASALSAAALGCIAAPKPGHPSLTALPDSYWRGLAEWADLEPAERDLLARASIVQRNRKTMNGRPFSSEVPGNLAKVPGYPERLFVKDGAEKLSALIDAVSVHLKNADPGGLLKLGNTFRGYDEQRVAWAKNLERYFLDAKADLAVHLKDGRYSDDAVCALAATINARYAFPGYSNHQSGKAIDFHTRHGKDGPLLDAVTSDAPVGDTGKSVKQLWCESPIFVWLHLHARDYGFVQAPIDEPWHWEYDPAAARNPERAGFVAPSCRK